MESIGMLAAVWRIQQLLTAISDGQILRKHSADDVLSRESIASNEILNGLRI
jgi:hypothetical protein